MMHFGNYTVTRTKLFATLTIVLGAAIWLNVNLAGIPLVPLALIVVGVALLW